MKILQVLPRGWTLNASTKAGELWHFYEEAKVTNARTPTGLFIQFPLVETGATFDLFRIISVTQPVGNGSCGRFTRRFTPLPAYIATSENRQLFAELQTEDVGDCLTPIVSSMQAICCSFSTLVQKNMQHGHI